MSEASEYEPPKVWAWEPGNGGRFANINRPIAGPTHDKDLPVGEHPLQLYSLGTPNGVKVTIMFRGREMQHPELGRKILENVADEVDHVGKVEFHPRQDGRNMVMVLAPDKQAQARHEKERRKAEVAANAATAEAVALAADEEE